MPIFEYKCDQCGSTFEKLVRSAGTAPAACPSCGHTAVTKQLSVFAAHAASSRGSGSELPMQCPSGGVCPHPEVCGRN